MLKCLIKNWRDFATAGMAVLVLCLLRQSKDFLIVLKIGSLDGTMANKGFAIMMAYLFDFSFSPVSGILMSKLGRKWSLGSSLLVMCVACGLLGTSLANSIPAVVAIAGLAGAGNGLSSGTGMTIGSDFAVQREKEGAAKSKSEFLGPWSEMQDIGSLLGPVIAGTVIATLGFDDASRACFTAGVAALAFMIFFVEETFPRPQK